MGTKANVLVGDVAVSIDGVALKTGGLEEAGLLPIASFYTVDGVTLTISSSFADIKVEENVGTVIRKLVDQDVKVTMNIAEGELANIVAAVPGSEINVGGDIITIGGGDLQEFEMTLVGESPGGGTRTITLNEVNPTGEMSMPFKKGEISVIPVTFSCVVDDTGEFGTIVDS